MKATLEREIKLHAPAGFELPELGGERGASRVFVSTYFDAGDHRLAQRGVTLRHRVENGKGLWQLKLPRGAARLELELEGGPASVPARFRELLVAYVRGDALLPVARLKTRRESVRVPGAEVVHDSVAVLDGRRVTRSFDELEIELLEGDEKALRRLEKALKRAGAGDAERRPKVFQALDLEYQPSPAAPAEGAPPGEAVRAMLRLQLERMLLRDPGTRLGTDPEELHQLRVATRRLRAYLRAARPLLGAEWSEAVGEELRWAAAELGRVRDLDVMLEHCGAEIAALDPADRKAAAPFLRRLRGQRTSARRTLLVALASERYLALLDRLEAGPPEAPADEPTLTSIWEREFRKLRKTMRALEPESPDGEFHAARIRAKKARYAAELAAPELGSACAELVKGAKALQDVLGEHQDAVVAEERIRAVAAVTPVRAGGGLITRRGHGGELEVAVVHRPRYDDWSFPKGKAGLGESDEECALREVEEETGFRCELVRELPSTRYVDGRGRDKDVRYWEMRLLGGEFQPTDEIDELRWLTRGEAERLLSYERDAALLVTL